MINNNLLKRILSSIILLPISLYVIVKGSFMMICLIFICFTVACYEWHMMSKKKFYKVYGFIFLIISFYSFYELSIEAFEVLFVVLICISTDVGGYVFGKIFKGPKITKISPNKTYAGMIGGYFLSFILLLVIINVINNQESFIKLFFVTLLISSVSQVGDIIVSYFKRLSKIKNTGNLIPGHGGLLDRIDGMIFAFPIFYLVNLTGYFNL